jgi:hypothetical protein
MSAAFGSHSSLTSFQSPPTADSIHTLSFQAALQGALDALLFRNLSYYPLMRLIFRLPIPSLQRKLHQMTEAYDELKLYMLEMISSARSSFAGGPPTGTVDAALLRNLVEANSKQEGEHKSLTDDELVADVFVSFPPCIRLVTFQLVMSDVYSRRAWYARHNRQILLYNQLFQKRLLTPCLLRSPCSPFTPKSNASCTKKSSRSGRMDHLLWAPVRCGCCVNCCN